MTMKNLAFIVVNRKIYGILFFNVVIVSPSHRLRGNPEFVTFLVCLFRL